MNNLINVFFKNNYHNSHHNSTIYFISYCNTRHWYYEGQNEEGAASYGLKSCNALHVWKAGHGFQPVWSYKVKQIAGDLEDVVKSLYGKFISINYINTTDLHEFDNIYELPKDAWYEE